MSRASKTGKRQHPEHYAAQWSRTRANKAKRVRRSNGEAFFRKWDALQAERAVARLRR